jgi:protein tyrosine phosphatase (PTP) superfamily phosphohydrolase (DUF442 family)
MRRLTAIVAVVMVSGCAQPLAGPMQGAPTPVAAVASLSAEGPQVDLAALARVEDAELEALPPGDLDRFHKLDDGVFRGARPTDVGLQKLKDKGVRTIISLEDDMAAVAHERKVSERLGIRHISLPMSAKSVPKLKQAQDFLKIANDKAMQPVYFHCKWGRDRTGTMAYVYRVTVQGWSHDRAWSECVNLGFRRILLGLAGFIKWYGWKYARQEVAPPAVVSSR